MLRHKCETESMKSLRLGLNFSLATKLNLLLLTGTESSLVMCRDRTLSLLQFVKLPRIHFIFLHFIFCSVVILRSHVDPRNHLL